MPKKIVRLAGTDLKGEKKIAIDLRGIDGVSHAMANAILESCSIPKEKKVKDLDKKETKRLQEAVKNPDEKIPTWLLNRRRDLEEGEDTHKFGGKVGITERMDIKRMKEIQSWKGIRHSRGLPVRGQKTQHKGGGETVGVQREKIKAAAKKKREEEE